jgi:NADH dehydrogenase FAD-containing subunit
MKTPSVLRVVIVGGGFAGLTAAKNLRRLPVEVTLIDRRNFHLFQPLLYQVATGGLSPANIATRLRGLLRRQSSAGIGPTGLELLQAQPLGPAHHRGTEDIANPRLRQSP